MVELTDRTNAHMKLIYQIAAPLVIQLGWWIYTLTDPVANFGRFIQETPYVGILTHTNSPFYVMTITMIFGSFVAGATSEGGGAIAFPVMTLLLGVPPPVARDFSLAIQSFGMTSASCAILGLRIPIDKEILLYCTLGGSVGMVFGLALVAPFLPPAFAKMLFVSIFFTFVVALFLLNRNHDRVVHGTVQEAIRAPLKSMPPAERAERLRREIINARIILVAAGFAGGIFSSFSGSGIDMAMFSTVTLFFRLDEKVATPTSVILMAINAVLGISLRSLGWGGAPIPVVWEYVYVCVPVVTIFAPCGAKVSSLLTRQNIVRMLYFLDTVQFVGALAIVKPWAQTSAVALCLASAAALVGGSLFFWKLADWGRVRDIDEETVADSGEDSDGSNQSHEMVQEHSELESVTECAEC